MQPDTQDTADNEEHRILRWDTSCIIGLRSYVSSFGDKATWGHELREHVFERRGLGVGLVVHDGCFGNGFSSLLQCAKQ